MILIRKMPGTWNVASPEVVLDVHLDPAGHEKRRLVRFREEVLFGLVAWEYEVIIAWSGLFRVYQVPSGEPVLDNEKIALLRTAVQDHDHLCEERRRGHQVMEAVVDVAEKRGLSS